MGRPKRSGRPIFKTTSLPAPVGGLNARDSIAEMPPTDASIMENWFPSTTSVDLRNGYTLWQTGLPAWAESLFAYNGLATKKLFCAAGTAFYDVTTKGGTPSSVVTGLANARWQYTNVGTYGGQFLLCCNGVDTPYAYNGTTWQAITAVSAPLSLTGNDPATATTVDAKTFIAPHVHKQRTWFIQKNTSVVFYTAAGSVTGALSYIDLTQFFKLGGYCVAMASWTVATSGGVIEYGVFLSSEGEVLAYDGTDPSSSTTWKLAARFRVGRPIGNRPFCMIYGDVAVITAEGLFPLSKALVTGVANQDDSISAKIMNLINTDVISYQANFGWQVILHPTGNKLIVNVPYAENTTQYQYVMNTITNAWTKFTGWNAACFEVQKDNLYFGGNGAIYQADTGQSDNGANITALCRPGFSYFETPGYNKMFTMVRQIFLTAGSLNPVISLNVDFQTVQPTSTPTYSNSGSTWDVAPWDTSPWSSPNTVQAQWQTAAGIGKAATIYTKIASMNQNVNWQATDYIYQMGSIL
jgi:hypothetical protein